MSVIPCGTCIGESLVNGDVFVSKTYGLEEAMELRALFYAGAVTIQNGWITVHQNVKAEGRARIYRLEYDSSFSSPANGGASHNECAPFKPTGKIKKPTDKYIRGFSLKREQELCYNQFYGTWKQDLMNPGANYTEQNTFMNDWLLEKEIRNANIQIEKLIWNGDYKSADDTITHFDGIVKKLFQAIGATSVAQVDRFDFSGLTAGDHIEGFVGGVAIDIPFNTDNNTTVGDLVTALTALEDPFTGDALFTVANTPASRATVTANTAGRPNNIVLKVTDGTGLTNCYDPNNAGTGTVTYTLVTENEEGDEPITIDYAVITVSNVLSEMEKLYTAISVKDMENGRGLLSNPNSRLFVSRHIFNMYNLAVAKIATDTSGIQGVFTRDVLAPLPYLPANVMVFASPENLHFGTDLINDYGDIRIWDNADCETVRFRGKFVAGVQVDRFSEVACNLENAPFSFQPAQNENPS